MGEDLLVTLHTNRKRYVAVLCDSLHRVKKNVGAWNLFGGLFDQLDVRSVERIARLETDQGWVLFRSGFAWLQTVLEVCRMMLLVVCYEFARHVISI